MKQHIFDVEIAEKYGLEAAIIFKNISFWIQKNEANESNFYDGDYWTYNSIKAFRILFPYMSEKKIRLAIDILIKEKLLKTGNYNKSAYDRTKWYAFDVIGKSICLFGQIDSPIEENGIAAEGEPIPYINTYINSDVNSFNKPPKGNKEKASTNEEILETYLFGTNLNEKIKEWLQYKKEKKENYKETGFKSLCRMIDKQVLEHGEQKVIDLIDLSMSSNWKGIIWDKINEKTKQKAVTDYSNIDWERV